MKEEWGEEQQVCRGAWARVTVDRLRRLLRSAFKQHRVFSNIVYKNILLQVVFDKPPNRIDYGAEADHISVRICTWNLGNAAPPQDLCHWVRHRACQWPRVELCQ